jgi:SiaC family regulatory phosphoprotein
MKNINIESSLDSPKVVLDYEHGLIEFEGKSYPGDAFTFYEPITAWLKEYFNGECRESTTLNMKLQYFNSATVQILYSTLDMLKESKCKNLKINWYYQEDDENSYEDFEDIAEEFPTLSITPIPY